MPKSILNKVFVSCLLLLPGAASFTGEAAPDNCAGVKLEIQVTSADAGQKNGSVEAIVTGAEKPVYYIFYKTTGQLLSQEFTLSKLKNIEQGTYYCSIVDGKGCTKKTEFKIE